MTPNSSTPPPFSGTYRHPGTPVDSFEYAGFWPRVVASLIDSVLVLCATLPLLLTIYGWNYLDASRTGFVAGGADVLLTWVAPAAAVVAFWLYRQATPGKMALSMKVGDAQTGNALTLKQSVARYLAYFVSIIPLGLGLLWVAFDPKKRGWHDKPAGMVVVRSKKPDPARTTS
jgi:uncharacterized RDD family membrane protein YckC